MRDCSACGRPFTPANGKVKRCRACRFPKGTPWRGTTYGMRACAHCGRYFLAKSWNAVYCCRAHKDAASRSTRHLYDNPQHRALRRSLKPVVALGETRCARGAECVYAETVDGELVGGFIKPGEQWDLDHGDNGVGYRGPSHRRCNRRTAAHRKARERDRSRYTSRAW